MGLSQRFSRAALGICMTAWAFSMVVVGLLLMLKWSVNLPARVVVIGGAVLIAFGQYVFALAASRMFPEASPRLTGAMEVLPLLGLVAFIAGALLWKS